MHDFYEQLERFSKRTLVKAEPLAKATTPTDYRGLVRALDMHGADHVDHTPHLSAHPPQHQSQVDTYGAIVAPETPVFKRMPSKLEGVTKKIVYAVPQQGEPSKTNLFLVKPYHERITRPAKKWMHHTIQGWAEMTNQALYHAAGIGHIHQAVHTALHNMGPGHPAEPAVVVSMHPKAKLLTNMHPAKDPYGEEAKLHFHESMLEDLVKVGAMDFLSKNLDRHEHNLMYIPEGHMERGQGPASRLLAIDHGRNFQYKSSVKAIPQYKMVGPIKVRLEPHERVDPHVDNLANYIFSRAGKFIMAVGKHMGYAPPPVLTIMQGIADWWPHVADEVVNEFEHHLRSIKSPQVRDHIKKNFMERVRLLNAISIHPEAIQHVRDTDIPIHPFQRQS
jgi:hypothetical protein